MRSLIVPSKHRSGCLLHPTEETLGQVPDEFAREHPSDLRPLQLPAGNQPGGPLSPSRRESKGVCTVRFRQPSQSLLVSGHTILVSSFMCLSLIMSLSSLDCCELGFSSRASHSNLLKPTSIQRFASPRHPLSIPIHTSSIITSFPW